MYQELVKLSSPESLDFGDFILKQTASKKLNGFAVLDSITIC